MRRVISRRELLAASSWLALSPVAFSQVDPFPTDARARLAVSTYPFRSMIAAASSGHGPGGSQTVAQFAATVPQAFGVTGIELWSPHLESTRSPYIRSLHAKLRQAGVHVVNVAVDAPVLFCDDDANVQEENLRLYQTWIDAAVGLESPGIRIHLPAESGGKGRSDHCVDNAFDRLTSYATARGIIINLENDNPKSERAARIVSLVRTVNSRYLRALPDFCNSMLAGSSAYNYQSLTALFQYAYGISHVKDSETDGHRTYRVDLGRVFAIASKAKYRGYFSMEWEGDGDPHEGTRHLIAESLRRLSA